MKNTNYSISTITRFTEWFIITVFTFMGLVKGCRLITASLHGIKPLYAMPTADAQHPVMPLPPLQNCGVIEIMRRTATLTVAVLRQKRRCEKHKHVVKQKHKICLLFSQTPRFAYIISKRYYMTCSSY